MSVVGEEANGNSQIQTSKHGEIDPIKVIRSEI
jgi:hypothetical protein